MSAALPAMHCDEFVERVTDYLEGALSPHDHARLETHLEACAHCAHYLLQIERTLTLTGKLSQADVAPEIRNDLMEVFARWQAERGRSSGA